MSSQSCSSSNPYSIPLVRYYTGTKDQPDNVSIFYKDKNGNIDIKDENVANSMGHKPFSMNTAVLRIQEAVNQVFEEINLGFSREDSDLWNAFKNLARGMVQLFPLVGNATLYVFDYFRTNFYFHPKIKATLASENSPVMGFAFDGKIIATFSPEEMNASIKRSASSSNTEGLHDPLVTLEYIWTESILVELKAKSTFTRLELAQDLERRIKAGSLGG